MDSDTSILRDLFRKWAGVDCKQYLPLGANGSNRKYFRLSSGEKSCIAAVNDDIRENEAFIYYSRSLAERGIRVPELYAISDDRRCYLQQDLGDTTLYSYLYAKRQRGEGFDEETLALYKKVLSDLALIQTRCRDLDFSYAYPRPDFDSQAIQWDLNYFKYFFLKLFYVPFDEQLLENDYHTLIDYLLAGDCSSFMYRDFQTRNIMVVGEDLYYIDYQGARRGAPQYDAASLLYSSKAEIPEAIRQELLAHYVDCYCGQSSSTQTPCVGTHFTSRFYGYVLIRILQAMGAYGYRGLYERKDYFIASIPLAIANLRTILQRLPEELHIPHLRSVLEHIVNSKLAVAETHTTLPSDTLTVDILSFSFKKGLPNDTSGNGGGFIFDCRALPNPGRYPEYRSYTGKDPSVIEFLQKEPAVDQFLEHVKAIVAQSVEKYIERKFSHLQVAFGCTGGQHRSVYCAERLAAYLRNNYDCNVVVTHREQS